MFHRGYVRKYFKVLNRAFLHCFIRDFDQFCAQFPSVNQKMNNRCKNRVFPVSGLCAILRLMCKVAHLAALTLSLVSVLSSRKAYFIEHVRYGT